MKMSLTPKASAVCLLYGGQGHVISWNSKVKDIFQKYLVVVKKEILSPLLLSNFIINVTKEFSITAELNFAKILSNIFGHI